MALGDIRERKFEVSTQTGHVMGTSVPVRVVSTKPGEGHLARAPRMANQDREAARAWKET